MPRTELPSGAWIEWTNDWMSDVRFHVKTAVVFRTTVDASGGARSAVQESDAANDDRQRLALWEKVITAWSFADKGIPIPSQNAGGRQVILATLSGKDYNAFAKATQELFDEVTENPTSPTSATASSTN